MRLIFFGDSICHGQHVSIDDNFPTRVAARLRADHGSRLLVENRSINGNTTRQALERMGYDVTSHRPQIVYVQFGLNDCNVWQTDFGVPRVTLPAYAANLAEIVDKARAAGALSVVLATNHPCLLGDAYEARLVTYNAAVCRVARETGATLFDVRSAPFETGRMLLEDGLHLSAAGHAFYAGLLAPVLDAEVRSLSAAAEA